MVTEVDEIYVTITITHGSLGNSSTNQNKLDEFNTNFFHCLMSSVICEEYHISLIFFLFT